jgi:hypothetical protein
VRCGFLKRDVKERSPAAQLATVSRNSITRGNQHGIRSDAR